LDDEFAMSVGDYDDLDDLKTKLRQSLVEQAENQAEAEFEASMWEKLLEAASFEYPEIAVDREINAFQDQFAAQFRQQGMDMESFWQLTGTTQEEWRQEIRPQALESMKRRLVLAEIVKEVELEVTDDEVAAQIDEMLEPLGERANDMRQMFDSEAGRASVTDSLLSEKALEHLKTLLRQDVETDATGDEQEAAADEQVAPGGEPEATTDEAAVVEDQPEAAADEPATVEGEQKDTANDLEAAADEPEAAADGLETAEDNEETVADEQLAAKDEQGADAKKDDVKNA
jgi:hypothetical protein